MEKENKFDKNKYNIQYKKDNYKRFVMELKPDFKDLIYTYSKDIGMNQTEFVTSCINYCIENGVFLRNKWLYSLYILTAFIYKYILYIKIGLC